MRGQLHAPDAIYPRKRPCTHFTGGWVGPRVGLDRCGKSRPPPAFDPRTVQFVASRYTDYATRSTPTGIQLPKFWGRKLKCFFGTSATVYKSTRRNIEKDLELQQRHCQNLKLRIVLQDLDKMTQVWEHISCPCIDQTVDKLGRSLHRCHNERGGWGGEVWAQWTPRWTCWLTVRYRVTFSLPSFKALAQNLIG